jgi:hypothetical protein
MSRRAKYSLRLPVLSCAFILACAAIPGHADDIALKVLETEDLRLLYFDPQQTYLVPHVARSFQNSLDFQRRLYGWEPYDDKVTVLLKDFIDYGNASASASPTNVLMFDIAPAPHSFETVPFSERIYSTMNHELVHLVQGDSMTRQDERWRSFFFGKVGASTSHPESILYQYLTAPRTLVPRWLAEGVAVFQETWMAGGIGRTQGAYDEMVFRAMVRDDAHFYSNLGIVAEGTRIDFQVGANAYLYGTRFVGYLALTYSPEKVVAWVHRTEGSERYYAREFRRVFGKDLEAVWDDWIAWEHEFQRANLASVRQHPLTPVRHLTPETLGSVSKSFVDTQSNSLVGAYRPPGHLAHVGTLSLADGHIEHLVDIKGPMLYQVTSAAFDPAARTFFYTTDNNAWRDLVALDLNTGKTRELLHDARIGDLAFDASDRTLWGLRHLDGYVTLVRMPYPYDRWSQVHTWAYGEIPFELDVSRDGSMISMSVERLDGTRLQVFRRDDLLAERMEPLAEFDFGTAIPEGFVFSPDGRYLYGSSYYTGISNIFRYEIATRQLEAVSNAETGLFRPIPRDDGTLIVTEYTGTGFRPAVIEPKPLEDLSAIRFLGNEIVRAHPVVKSWAVGSPARVQLDKLITHEGDYHPLRSLELTSAYPIVEGYRGSTALGWNALWMDPIGFNTLDASISGSLDGGLDDDERLHADIEYRRFDWRFRYWHNDADFYDLFGPTKRARKGDAFILGYDHILIYDEPRRLDVSASLASYTGLETLPGNQNVEAGFEDLVSGHLALKYAHMWKSLGAVDQEKGWRWELGGFADRAKGDTFTKPYAELDVGVPLPWRNSSVWLYSAAGTVDGDRSSSLGNWYFGGFGNNYVDDGEIKRYRELTAFPGFEIDEIEGQDFAKGVLEWNVTPMYFEEAGSPAFYLTWLRPALFAGALVTDLGDGDREETWSTAGVQVDFGFTVVHRLPLTLSIGFAQGFVDGHRHRDEWMLSLKLM